MAVLGWAFWFALAFSSAEATRGIRLSLLLDTSNSMTEMLPSIGTAATEVAGCLGPGDAGELVTFGSKVDRAQTWTENPVELKNAVMGLKAAGTSSLYNALFIALKYGVTTKEPRPHVIVVISDGDDTSSLVKRKDVESVAIESASRIYSILLPGRRGNERLSSITDPTGGREWTPRNETALGVAVQELCQELERVRSLE